MKVICFFFFFISGGGSVRGCYWKSTARGHDCQELYAIQPAVKGTFADLSLLSHIIALQTDCDIKK